MQIDFDKHESGRSAVLQMESSTSATNGDTIEQQTDIGEDDDRDTSEALYLYLEEKMTSNNQSSRNKSSEDVLVRVCDICGDAGRKKHLAVCNKCEYCAEHTYCMRVSMETLPDSSWMCEECTDLEEEVKMISAKSVDSVTGMRGPDRESEVKQVCNICGVAGRKKHLAVCSKCEDSAEHTYCMRVAMDQLPDSTWMCEECAVSGQIVPFGHNQTKITTLSSVDSMHSSQARTLMIKEADREANIGLALMSIDPSYRPTATSPDFQITAPGIAKEHDTKKSSRGHRDSYRPIAIIPAPRIKKKHDTNETKLVRSSRGHRDSYRPLAISPAPRIKKEHETKLVQSSRGHRDSYLPTAISRNIQSTAPRIKKEHDTKLVQSSRGHRDSDRPIATSPNFQSAAPRITKEPDTVDTKLAQSSRGHRDSDRPTATSPNFQSAAPRITMEPDTVDTKLAQSSRGHIDSDCPTATSPNFQSTAPSIIKEHDTNDTKLAQSSRGADDQSQLDPADTACKQLPQFAFPDLGPIWRGEFDIQQCERIPNVLYMLQAHKSILASPRIPQVVREFPCTISLKEVSRMDAWPDQFREHGPPDSNIALYFFAQDNMSYANYKGLLHSMTEHDLALQANISGIEILIFSSRLLPHGSQKWNGRLFLWGLFRGRKVVESRIAD